MNVLITGCSGYIGTKLTEELLRENFVLGIDVKQSSIKAKNFLFFKRDICSDLSDVFENYHPDVVVHLAFVVSLMHNRKEMYRINAKGSRNIFKHIPTVKKFIMTSSATVYGAHPDNKPFLGEEDPLRAGEKFDYAYHKVLVEKILSEYNKEGAEIYVLRPCIVMGPNVNNYISRYFRKKFVFLPAGLNPDFQILHEDDVVNIIHRMIDGVVPPGIYNVAPDDTMSLLEIWRFYKETFKNWSFYLPVGILKPLTWIFWRLHIYTEAPEGMIDFLVYPWTVSSKKLHKYVKIEKSTKETVADFLKNYGSSAD